MKVKFMRRIISSVLAMCFAVSATSVVSAEIPTRDEGGMKIISVYDLPGEMTPENANAEEIPVTKARIYNGVYSYNEEPTEMKVYTSKDELPEKFVHAFGDTDFSTQEVIQVPCEGLMFDDTFENLRATDTEFFVNVECDWQGYDSLYNITTYRAIVFSVDKSYNISGYNNFSVYRRNENTSKDKLTEPEKTEVEYSNPVVVGNYETDEDYVPGYNVYRSVDELPAKIAKYYQDTDFTKYEVAFIPYIGGYYDESLVKMELGGMKHNRLFLSIENNWGENTNTIDLAVHRAAVFEIDKDFDIEQYMDNLDITIKNVHRITVPDDAKMDEAKADVNGDGKIDVRDLMEASQHIVSTFDYDENFDVNDDGKSNILDLMIIAKSIVE